MNYFKLEESLSNYNSYCSGIIQSTESCYLSAIVLGAAKVDSRILRGSQGLSEILAYDKAEIARANIGQINMIPVSSFCGIRGAIWGYDVMPAANLRQRHEDAPAEVDGIPVYTSEPLQLSAEKLFGTIDNKNFPLMPGSHVPCAYKANKGKGPAHLFAGSAIAIPKDRYKNACLFMEDQETWYQDSLESSIDCRRRFVKNLALSVLEIGKNQRVEYKEIFVGIESVSIGPDEVGCALVAHPYFNLARNAVNDNILKNYNKITTDEWLSLML